MRGYFLDLARLALGTGPRLEARIAPVWEAEWNEEEAAPSEVAPLLRVAPSVVATTAAPTSVHHAHEQTTVDHHAHFELRGEITEGERTIEREIRQRESSHTTVREATVRETIQATERTIERHEREVKETRESLRQLIQEARTIRERSDREKIRSEVERAVPSAPREFERRMEVERLVREVQKSSATETERTHELRVERDAPTVEVHIGRIEVRAPASSTPPQGEARKPKGVIDLNDYLRERSRGAS